jgi:diguanylate cyclase (GGDEF)-like protein
MKFDLLGGGYRKQRDALAVGSLLLIPLIGFLDYLTGPDFTFSLIYLIPVSLIAWFIGKRLAIIASFICGAVWIFADFAAGRFSSNLLAYLWNFITRLVFLLIIVLLLSLLKQTLLHERELSRTDPLTHALNVRAFRDVAELEIIRSKRYHHPFTVVYLDIDDFKLVNDNFGHNAGDSLLHYIVKTIINCIRANDHVARVGGDEFVILLPETGTDAASLTADKIRENLTRGVREINCPVTFSIGVLTCIQAPPTVDKMIELADHLMYSVKNKAKDGIEFLVFRGEQPD